MSDYVLDSANGVETIPSVPWSSSSWVTSADVQWRLIDDDLMNFINETQGRIKIKVHYSPQIKDGKIQSPKLELPKNVQIPQFDDKEMYPNFSTPKGQCLVINNRDFYLMNNRTGTDQDRDNVTDLFTQLGYIVKIKNNLTKKQMVLAIKSLFNDAAKFAKRGRCDSIVLIILTHGMEGFIFGVDGVPSKLDTGIPVPDIVKSLADTGHAVLASKPKLLFVQACRAYPCRQPSVCDADDRCRCHDDHGHVEVAHPRHDEPDMALLPRETIEDVDRIMSTISSGGKLTNEKKVTALQLMQKLDRIHIGSKCKTVANDSHIFVGMSTTPGRISWRNRKRGSWYIQAICQVFAEHACHMHIKDLMTRVDRVVAESFHSQEEHCKQVPEEITRLLKDFYFFPERTSSKQKAKRRQGDDGKRCCIM